MRILVVDDHEIIRRGVCAIISLRPDLEVCGEASDGFEALIKALETNPDLAILDVTMPKLDGISAAKQIKKLNPHILILILSMHSGQEIVQHIRQTGAEGFVNKSEVGDVLLTGVDSLLQGRTFFPNSDESGYESFDIRSAK